MLPSPFQADRRRLRAFPTIAFVTVVCAVCIGVVGAAIYDFYILSHLRREYLDKRGHEIAGEIDALARGPGRRDNPAVWQAEFEKAFAKNRQWLGFIVLLDDSGHVLAGAGELPPRAPVPPRTDAGESGAYVTVDGVEQFIFETQLYAPQRSQHGAPSRIVGWRLRMGLRTGPAGYIHQHAYAHLLLAGVVVGAIGGLSFYFLRTLRRFLELQRREQSEKHLAALGRMAATLAHEIRNPLSAMKGLTQVAQEELPKDHRTQPLMQTVVGEAERLERLVTDLLTFARPREPQIRAFDLCALVDSVATVLRPSLEPKQVTLKVMNAAEAFIIDSDENGLRQVLLNLLLNAVEATPAGGEVVVRMRCDLPCRALVIEIDDTGAGLGDRDAAELFQPFATSKATGTGLGLVVSRQIVEGLGGAIALANRAAGGARCTIQLPVACAKTRAAGEAVPASLGR